jgi:hypothetical protein
VGVCDVVHVTVTVSCFIVSSLCLVIQSNLFFDLPRTTRGVERYSNTRHAQALMGCVLSGPGFPCTAFCAKASEAATKWQAMSTKKE